MLSRVQRWKCLVRPLYIVSSQRMKGSFTKTCFDCQQSYLPASCLPDLSLTNSLNSVTRYSVWTLTQTRKCSSASYSDLEDDLKTDAEETETKNQSRGGDDDESPRIKAARLELEVMRNSGLLVPASVSDGDFEYFSTLNSRRSRKKFVGFLYKKEQMQLKEKEKKRQLRKDRELETPKEDKEDLDGPMKNRIFLHLQAQSILQFDNWHLASGMKFGPKVVYDFSYEEHMKRPEIISLVKQLMHSVGANKLARDPFDIHWAGLQGDSATMREMKRMLRHHLDSIMINITDRQVQDIFPFEDIVYLTADSPNIMRSYNPSKVYVIGALVDSHRILRGVSFAKAKRLGLNHARLPLDLFLKWSTGGKNLTLDQVIHILIELNTSGDWVRALSHVPTRKHTGLKSEQPTEKLAATHNQEQRTPWEGSPRHETRYSASRAKHSRRWAILDDSPFERSKRVSNTLMRQRARQIVEGEDDPANETIFNPSGGSSYRKKNTQGSNKDKQWYEN